MLTGADFWLRSTAGHPSDSYPGQHWLVVSQSWWKFEGGVISGCIKPTQSAAGTAIGDHAMTKTTETSAILLLACEAGFDPIEDRLRANIRGMAERPVR
jgi:hypothetical protein